jgi:outer membrane biosynthesis protein TonB
VRVGLGPRFLIEAVFLVAVAIVAGVERLRTILIVALMAAAWILVAVVEFAWARLRTAASQPGPAAAETEAPAEPPAAPEPARVEEPPPAPEVQPAPVEDPSAAAEGEPAPDAPPPERPVLTAVPAPDPQPPPPEPEAEPPPEQPPSVVALPDRSPGPRRWNVWDLERVARRPTGDTARDEERAYLLLYLREFAGPDGLLPPDFDAVVREAFGDVLDPAYS